MVYKRIFQTNEVFHSWHLWALLSLVICLIFEVIRYVLPIGGETGLLYIFFPCSLMVLSLMVYTRRYTQYPEIKFLFAFFAWMCFAVVINHSRAHILESYTWFSSVSVTTFLCFSFSYALKKKASFQAYKILSIVMILSVTFLSVLGLLVTFFPGATKVAPTLLSGFGIFEGRLWLDNHPNRSAPFCAISLALTFIAYTQIRQKLARVFFALSGLICYVALALTDSRTAIIGLSAAIGLVIFLVFNTTIKNQKAVTRIIICGVFACLAVFASYKGAGLIQYGYNTISLRNSVNNLSSIEKTTSGLTNINNPESINTSTGESSNNEPSAMVTSRDLSDIGTFNGRTDIWINVLKGLIENPEILVFGTGPAVASKVMSPYFPTGSPVGIFHNSFLGTLVSFGLLGLLFAFIFLVMIAGAALKLTFRDLTNIDSLGARMVSSLLLLTVTESMMEDFLFANNGLNVTWIWFMISAGFVFRYLKEDNRKSDQNPNRVVTTASY